MPRLNPKLGNGKELSLSKILKRITENKTTFKPIPKKEKQAKKLF